MTRNIQFFGVVVVMIVTVLASMAVDSAAQEDEGDGVGPVSDHKVTICHKDHVTISVDRHAEAAHLNHGDEIGACDGGSKEPSTSPPATCPPVTSPPATSPPATSPPATSPPATCPPATSPPATSPPATTLTTDATDATLPNGTISDQANLTAPDGTDGEIVFKLYGPFAADEEIGADDCVDPDPNDPQAEHNLVFTSTKTVPDDEVDPINNPGQYTSDSYPPTGETAVAGTYQWVATFTPADGEPVSTPCGETTEQSVVNEAGTTATEQNMTLAAEIGGAANPADPATDTTNSEGTNQNENSTLGTDNENDDLYGDSRDNNLYGLHGNDFVNGGRGADKMVGGAQDDSIYGADGVAANDVINGGIGTDYCVGDEGDKFKNCDGNVVQVGVPQH